MSLNLRDTGVYMPDILALVWGPKAARLRRDKYSLPACVTQYDLALLAHNLMGQLGSPETYRHSWIYIYIPCPIRL